ncbi:MAG TPA: hypothetical protein VMU11_04245 [Verrucomicrobiae bacterium]|nr:hypothetical protein [Verrucomicrobiae bacterium]
MKEEEPVKTFGDFTERCWLMIMLFADVLKMAFEELKSLWREIDLSWIEEVNDRMMRDEDRKYYAAA